MRLSTLLLLFSAGLPLSATVLPAPEFGDGDAWHLPGGGKGLRVGEGRALTTRLDVPPRSDKERGVSGGWRGVLAVDVHGTVTGGAGAVVVEVLDPATGEVFAGGGAEVTGRAVRADWAVIASSGHPGAEAARAFDGDPKTDWHSRYGGDRAPAPHWIGLAFGSARKLGGLRYLPRQGGGANGVAREWKVEVRRAGGAWEPVAAGTSERAAVAQRREALEVRFDEPVEAEAFRFVITRDWSGGGFGTAAELEPLGVELGEPGEPVVAPSRVWLEVPAAVVEAAEGKSLAVRVKGTSGEVVLGAPHWCRIPETPDGKVYGKPNGVLGPDKVGAGLLGFEAIAEHRQAVLTVMKPREGSPAAKAGLKPGDAIVSVAGRPLRVNDVAPGWDWFHHSHEATLGRETEAALAAGRRSLELGVLRGNRVVPVAVPLGRTRAFTTMNPADDPEAAAMLGDTIRWLVGHQRRDGSWSGDMKRTTFAALALLAAGGDEHVARVKRAVDWGLERYPEPKDHGNLGFWSGAYMGILYSEWHLRTGDRRVVSHLEAMRDWAFDGRHPSKWEVPALGHGPSGLPYDQKALVAPACHLLVFEALAMRCGMESRLWELLMPYMEMSWSDPKEGGHGAMGYNRSYKDLGEFWSRSGLFAMACELRGERPDMRDALTAVMEERHPWIRNSHAYGEPGGALGLLGLNLATPDAFGRILREYGWWFSLAWEPGYGLRFTQPHMGAPYMGEDDLLNAAYALVLQASKRNLHLTGRNTDG